MGQPSLSIPSFSDFAKISSLFLQRVMCFSAKSLEEPEGQVGGSPVVAKTVFQVQEEVPMQETGT